ncbi:MAG: YfhO family protein, partial [Sinobacteraceae bacterium]|nr:YfhO family protein [Nevskiaceae bacterium]
LIALILSDMFETPLDWVLYHLLPGFEHLHPHAPERILTVAYVGPALLAGATISALHERSWWKVLSTRLAILSTRAAGVALVLGVVTLDLAVAGAKARADRSPRDPLDGIATLAPVDLATYYQPNGAASFLQQQLEAAPSRFLGYAPDVDGRMLAYTVRSFDPSTADLLVNNRAVALKLQDIQGYDASHLRRYEDFVAVLNGQTQNYHNADVFPHGLSSPLLDLLNARYVIIPRADHLDPADASPVLQRYPEVYADQRVRILENPSALPRAWVVHAAIEVGPDATSAPALIAGGEIDARQTAVLEDTPPPLEIPSDPSSDQARVTHEEADQLDITASTTATGLVVFSEVYYPAWKAYVDGRPTPLYVADGILRAVQVPPGEHTVELRFESCTLDLGILISSIALLLLVFFELAALMANCVQPREFRR